MTTVKSKRNIADRLGASDFTSESLRPFFSGDGTWKKERKEI